MKVKTLITDLSELDPEQEIYIQTSEWGYHPVEKVIDFKKIFYTLI